MVGDSRYDDRAAAPVAYTSNGASLLWKAMGNCLAQFDSAIPAERLSSKRDCDCTR